MALGLEEMKKRFAKYGSIYVNGDIQEDVDDIVGHEDKKELMDDFFLALRKYADIAPQLKAAKIVPNFTMLLYGPPGTGKTSLVKAEAKKHNIPIGVVEADRLVSPLLGDTLKNVRGVFDISTEFAKENGLFIVFFDEIDSITGERANAHEVGEIKRSVISFLQTIDKISNEAIPLAIFGATNHENQLDSAVWRRFTYHLKFEFPTFIVRKNIIESFVKRVEKATIGIDPRLNSSLIEEFALLMKLYQDKKKAIGHDLIDEELRELYKKVKEQNKEGLLYATQGYTGADLMRGMRVALFKALQKNVLLFDDYVRSLTMVGGTKTHVEEAQSLMNTPKPEKEKISNESSSTIQSTGTTPQKAKKTKSSLDIDL